MTDREGSFQQSIDHFRQRVNRRDEDATRHLITSYTTTRRRLVSKFNDLAREVVQAGDQVTQTQLMRAQAIKVILDGIEAEIERYTDESNLTIRRIQDQAIRDAEEVAQAIARSQAPITTWNGVDPAVLVAMQGRMQNGSPLIKTLGGVAPAVRLELETAILEGTNTRDVGRRIRARTNMPLIKATQIATDAILGSYRSASFASFEANSDILEGWVWVGALQGRTCAACLAMIGRRFPLSQRFMPAHSRCRCQPAPIVKGNDTNFQSGDEWLKRQKQSVQEEVLGIEGARLYRGGALKLEDFVQVNRDPVWGASVSQASIKTARENASGPPRTLFGSADTNSEPERLHLTPIPDRIKRATGTFADAIYIRPRELSKIRQRHPEATPFIENLNDALSKVEFWGTSEKREHDLELFFQFPGKKTGWMWLVIDNRPLEEVPAGTRRIRSMYEVASKTQAERLFERPDTRLRSIANEE